MFRIGDEISVINELLKLIRMFESVEDPRAPRPVDAHQREPLAQ
jgi:hypothetical protein